MVHTIKERFYDRSFDGPKFKYGSITTADGSAQGASVASAKSDYIAVPLWGFFWVYSGTGTYTIQLYDNVNSVNYFYTADSGFSYLSPPIMAKFGESHLNRCVTGGPLYLTIAGSAAGAIRYCIGYYYVRKL